MRNTGGISGGLSRRSALYALADNVVVYQSKHPHVCRLPVDAPSGLCLRNALPLDEDDP